MKIILSTIAIISILFFSVQYVEAIEEDKVNVFYGLANIFKDPDSIIKLYKSGGFSLKNYDLGIAIYAHPVSKTEMIKFVVLENGKVSRFIALMEDSITYNEISNDVNHPQKIEPKSSIGADISKWDIPTQGRNDYTIIIPEKEFDPDTLEIISSVPHFIEYKHILNFDFGVIDNNILSKTDQRVKSAIVNISLINPIGENIIHWNGITNNLGYFGDSWYVQDNEMLGQWGFNVTASFDNFTQKNTLVNFFVIPLDDDSTRKCPLSYSWNPTSMICEKETNE